MSIGNRFLWFWLALKKFPTRKKKLNSVNWKIDTIKNQWLISQQREYYAWKIEHSKKTFPIDLFEFFIDSASSPLGIFCWTQFLKWIVCKFYKWENRTVSILVNQMHFHEFWWLIVIYAIDLPASSSADFSKFPIKFSQNISMGCVF